MEVTLFIGKWKATTVRASSHRSEDSLPFYLAWVKPVPGGNGCFPSCLQQGHRPPACGVYRENPAGLSVCSAASRAVSSSLSSSFLSDLCLRRPLLFLSSCNVYSSLGSPVILVGGEKQNHTVSKALFEVVVVSATHS